MPRTKALPIYKALCPRCEGDRECDEHVLLEVPWRDETPYGAQYGDDEYRLLRCRGCRTVFYHRRSWDSESIEHGYDPQTGEETSDYTYSVETFPSPQRKGTVPDWTWELRKKDATLHSVLTETYEAKDSSLIVLATVGLRVALDRATVFLGMEGGAPLEVKIAGLLESGFISETMKMELDVVADAGNAAAHRSWSPNNEEFEAYLKIVETFIAATIIHGKVALKHAGRIPPREPRPKKEKAVTAPMPMLATPDVSEV